MLAHLTVPPSFLLSLSSRLHTFYPPQSGRFYGAEAPFSRSRCGGRCRFSIPSQGCSWSVGQEFRLRGPLGLGNKAGIDHFQRCNLQILEQIFTGPTNFNQRNPQIILLYPNAKELNFQSQAKDARGPLGKIFIYEGLLGCEIRF